MNRLLQIRFWLLLLLALLTAICGGLASYTAERILLIRSAGKVLLENARSFNSHGDNINDEAHGILVRMNRSPYEACSAAELDVFRGFTYSSSFVKDSGRVGPGQIVCSSMLGSSDLAIPLPEPFAIEPGGYEIYIDLSSFYYSKVPAFLIVSGPVYLSIAVPSEETSLPQGVTVVRTARDVNGEVKGTLPGIPESYFFSNGLRVVSGSLYATHCSIKYPHCVTMIQTLLSVELENRGQLLAFGVLGCPLGLLFFLLLHSLYLRHRTLSRQLRRAIRHDRVELAYQPIVQVGSRQMVGAEALARWRNEAGVAVSPEVFIQLAENEGYIRDLTRQLVRRALREWGDVLHRHANFRLSVNLSAYDLGDPSFLPWLKEELEARKLCPASLALEITESATARRGVVQMAIRELRTAGFSMHIDDFGTGYSSLAYLHELSVDAIKIDRSFTRAAGTGAVAADVLGQILAIARTLGLAVTIEGIETQEQEAFFVWHAQDYTGQGWLYGRPTSAKDLQARLSAQAYTSAILSNEDKP